jgi:hypothetical protein
MEINDLIAFIQLKVKELNNMILSSNLVIKGHLEEGATNGPALLNLLKKQSVAILVSQKKICFLMDALNDITYEPEQLCGQIVDKCIERSVEWGLEPDKTHPMYGYAPFMQKLHAYYLEHEHYEACMKMEK